jgi:hypothetical protein
MVGCKNIAGLYTSTYCLQYVFSSNLLLEVIADRVKKA